MESKYIHKFEQTSEKNSEWIKWRSGGLGASDISVILGSLPFKYQTTLGLWKLKVGIEEETFTRTEAVELGIQNEPIARKSFIERTGIEVEPYCVTHPDYPFLRASLDGLSKDGGLVELKCPQVTNFKLAKSGKILDYYHSQIQAQIGICNRLFGTSHGYYYAWRNNDDALFKIEFNEEYYKEIIRRGKLFWEMVEAREPALPRHFGINMDGESDPYIPKTPFRIEKL